MAKKEEPQEEEAPTGGKKKIIIIVVGALLLVGITVGATMMLLGGNSEPAATAESKEPPKPTKGDPMFTELKPFTVNLGADDSVGFLQVQIQILTFFEEVANDLEKNKPVIRNNLSLLFGRQKSQNLRSVEGKEALQKEIFDTVQKVVTDYGNGGEVAAVYFTNFVMQ